MTIASTCKVCGTEFTQERKAAPPKVTCSDECRKQRLRERGREAQARYRGTPDFPDKPCEICGTMFSPRRQVDKTCSMDCQIQWRRKLTREKAARHYKVRPPRPDFKCEACGGTFPTPRTGANPRWCTPCKANREDQRASKRMAIRRCHKCEVPVPGAERKPGITVCETCRADPRKTTPLPVKERRRTLRKYGLTAESFDQLLVEQGGRCRGCGKDDPGAKGWCVDHCHKSGRVRALMCHRCNMALGLALEDPATLRSLADFAEQWQQVLGEIKI